MSTLPLDWAANGASLAALLFAGHSVADFWLQPWRMVAGKRVSLRWLAAHGAVVFSAHAALLAPFHLALGPVLAVAAALAAVHMAIDAARTRIEHRFGRRLLTFVIDQAAHGITLVGVWGLRSRLGLDVEPRLFHWDPQRIGSGAAGLGILAFATNGGSAVVAGMLNRLQRGPTERRGGDPTSASEPTPHAGHLIGILERLVILPLVWLGQWGAIGFVLAAKSVARFKELEQRDFAETYLVGTLTSFLVACGCGLLLRALAPLG